MSQLKTIGKNEKSYNFRYESEEYDDSPNDILKILFRVYSTDEEYEDYFDFKIAPFDDNIVKVTDMFLDSKKIFKGRGIPAAMIFETQKLYPNHQIISSTNKIEYRRILGEWRSTDGSGVWDRLVDNGLALYNTDEDTYYLLR